MKKLILGILIAALGGTSVQTAKAGGWGLAGRVMTGVVAGAVVADALAPRPVYYAPYYAQVPVYSYPAYNYGYSYRPAYSVGIPPVRVVGPAPAVAYYPQGYVCRPGVVWRAPGVVFRPPAISISVPFVHVGIGWR